MKRFIMPILAGIVMATTAQAQTLERIKETGLLRLGYRVDAPPLSFQAADGNPGGYSPTICVELAQGILNTIKIPNMDVEFVPVGVQDRFDKVAAGEIDLLCGAASITMSRREKVDFSIPTFADGTTVLLPVGGSDNFADLSGKKLGVRRDTTTEEALTNTLADIKVFAEVVRFADHKAAMEAMEKGELDAYFGDQSILAGLWIGSPQRDKFKLGANLLTIEKHGLAMARGDTEFRLLVDQLLSRMYRTGVMQAIFQQTLPGVQPGDIHRAMFTMAPIPE